MGFVKDRELLFVNFNDVRSRLYPHPLILRRANPQPITTAQQPGGVVDFCF